MRISRSLNSYSRNDRRASRVDMKKLEKQETKLRVCCGLYCMLQRLDYSTLLGQDREACAQRSVRGTQAARPAQKAGA